MNFFDAQERARKNTRNLLLLMTAAVVAIVISVTLVIAAIIWIGGTNTASYQPFPVWALTNLEFLAAVALVIAAFIGIASLYRIVVLRQGGSRVARDLGATPISMDDKDPLRRRLYNVVEEMAIASGIPVPNVFVLDQEAGINAFAAGFRPEDAAVAVTRGTLETLNREELQGVVAHEFSHVLNGDMRLNIKLMGPLFGILSIGLLGRMLLRSNRRSAARSKGAGAAILLGAGLTITGYVGLFIGRLIKAGVSRQREYLADASAVQFTRQTKGISGALKKIAGLAEGSAIDDADAEEVSHMLFSNGLPSLSQALATHPPLFMRIHALDPSFTETQMAKLSTSRSQLEPPEEAAPGISGFADARTGAPNADTVLETVGHPADNHIEAARGFLNTIPPKLRASLGAPNEALLILPAMMLHSDSNIRQQQMALLTQQLGAARAGQISGLNNELDSFGYEARLPLLDLVLPVIKSLPAGRIHYLNDLLEQLAITDNRLELFEYALLRNFQGYMRNAAEPGIRQRWKNLSAPHMIAAAATLLAIFARHGNADTEAADKALRLGLHTLGQPAAEPVAAADWIKTADTALNSLKHCTPNGRQQVLRALLVTAMADGEIRQREAELLRAFCMMLDIPLPPILVDADRE